MWWSWVKVRFMKQVQADLHFLCDYLVLSAWVWPHLELLYWPLDPKGSNPQYYLRCQLWRWWWLVTWILGPVVPNQGQFDQAWIWHEHCWCDHGGNGPWVSGPPHQPTWVHLWSWIYGYYSALSAKKSLPEWATVYRVGLLLDNTSALSWMKVTATISYLCL
jgi:hypothetical protein